MSAFDGTNVLDVKPSDYGAAVLANKTVSFKTDGKDGIVQWTIASGDWPATGATAGLYYGQVDLNDTGTTTKRITEQFEIKVERGVQ